MSSYYSRRDEREQSKLRKEAKEAAHLATLIKIRKVVEVIEAAFQPEADAMYAEVLARWQKAYDNVIKYTKGEANTALLSKTLYGYDIKAYPSRPVGYKKYDPAFSVFDSALATWEAQASAWSNSKEHRLVSLKLFKKEPFLEYANKQAKEYVEDQKYKLLHALTSKIGGFKSMTVIDHSIDTGRQGFEGVFRIETEQGPIHFECRSIVASGPIQIRHFRFLSRVTFLVKK